MKSSMLIVGGGIAGIVAALRARAFGWSVTLVERQPELGGLLASHRPAGTDLTFDHGTHIPAATGEAALDDLLFGGLPAEDWHAFPVLHAGTYWNGRLSPDSACLDLRTLPASDYQNVLTGLLAVPPEGPRPFRTLAEQLVAVYGHGMWVTVFEPALHKLYGCGAGELAPEAHRLFGLIRFICLDPERVRELKRQPALDAKLALHDFRETAPGVAALPAHYPRRGGVGRWVEHLAARLVEAGVTVRTNVALTRLDPAAGTATAADGETFAYDQLVWSLPPAMLLRLVGHPAVAPPPPRFAKAWLHHFVTDAPPAVACQYVTCFDPARRSFRVTLYDNLQPERRGPSRVTVEVLAPDPAQPPLLPDQVFAELKQMGLLPAAARAERNFVHELGPAFPIQTIAYRAAAAQTAALVASDLPRTRLLGRAAGQGFFMRDVLLNAWRPLEPTIGAVRQTLAMA